MQVIENLKVKEKLYIDKLENGLTVMIIPKKGIEKKYIIWGTNYGSNDSKFIVPGETETIEVPKGVAHFLEHKLFEQENGTNSLDTLTALGVNANAYTTNDHTAYLFECTDNFYEALDEFMDYVQHPYFTDENVEKEKGIIEQEIKMYNDDPEWNVFFNALKAMYVNHPTRIDIAGSVESIYKITKEELYKCYNTFYNPGNMILFVVGDLDAEEVFECVRKSNHKDIERLQEEIVRFYPEEPKEVKQKEIVQKFPISMPMFSICFKDDKVNIKGEELLKYEVMTDILTDMLFKKGSLIYEDLYMKGLITPNFGAGFSSQIDYSYTSIGGESKDPRKVKEIIMNYIEKFKKEGLDKEAFERTKKKHIGNFIKYFDSVTFIANNFITYKFKGINLLDYVEVMKKVTFEEVTERLNDHFKEENCVISIAEPK